MTFALHQKDAIEFLKSLADNSIDSCVIDGPYGIGFMGKAWDGADIAKRHAQRTALESSDPTGGRGAGYRSPSVAAGRYNRELEGMRAFQKFSEEWAIEALRVLKPGGYLLSFSSPRTYHRMVCGIEDAGFEIRECIQWVFGSGFPKSKDFAKDDEASKTAGERIIIPEFTGHPQSSGWGTALKPAHEPIVMARKPLEGTVAENVLKWGTGALNIDGCRIGDETDILGRWPANLIHDGSEEVRAAFPDADGQQGDLKNHGNCRRSPNGIFGGMRPALDHPARVESDKSAARFFYCPKASRSDRNAGCEHIAPKPLHWSSGDQNPGSFQSEGTDKTSSNNHPTVKPTDLMRYLCRLVTPPGGTVLDFYMGSGSTGRGAVLEGFHFIGNDREADYVEIARARIQHAVDFGDEYEPPKPKVEVPEAQSDLFGK